MCGERQVMEYMLLDPLDDNLISWGNIFSRLVRPCHITVWPCHVALLANRRDTPSGQFYTARRRRAGGRGRGGGVAAKRGFQVQGTGVWGKTST